MSDMTNDEIRELVREAYLEGWIDSINLRHMTEWDEEKSWKFTRAIEKIDKLLPEKVDP